MLKQIINIDREKCTGCGLCASTCHQSAIAIKDGKAALLRDDYCDGLGKCLAVCPSGAISFETPDAPESDRAAASASALNQWPVQIKLVPVNAAYFENAHLLVAADCAAYSYGNFHHDFMKDKITLIGCPKLDEGDYSEKLTAILSSNNIKSVTVVRMEVPCCGGIEGAAKNALKNCGKMIPWQVVTISTDGKALD